MPKRSQLRRSRLGSRTHWRSAGRRQRWINGRLAMVGFVSALAVEAARGDGLLTQVANSAGLTWFAYTAVVLSAASLVSLLQGESAEGRSGGLFTAAAELWNGRLAMLGLIALAATDYLTGSPFVHM